jgi:hypothetical protein
MSQVLHSGSMKVKNSLEELFMKFERKGFMQVEIPALLTDVFITISNGDFCSIAAVNQELEDLGWGIEIIDFGAYDVANALIQGIKFADLERRMRECRASLARD